MEDNHDYVCFADSCGQPSKEIPRGLEKWARPAPGAEYRWSFHPQCPTPHGWVLDETTGDKARNTREINGDM